METNRIDHLIDQISGLSTEQSLNFLAQVFTGGAVFSSSLSYEDQVITHQLLVNHMPVEIFTLDTGRLFSETYAVWNSTNEKYSTRIRAFYPDAQALQEFVANQGPNSFYESVENRQKCCHIRKVEPLQRALAGKTLWITGLRAEHSVARQDLKQLEWDDHNKIIKFHPLLYWSLEDVKEYITRHHIPYNPLHDRGFISIGCAPCTRAIKPGEDFRSGRWWWEQADKKECGLHGN